MSSKFLTLVLARGGSKGIPRKNIKLMNGKPLLAYTIEEAKKSKYIDQVILSTDDAEIAKVGVEYGAVVPFLRPDFLATDETTSIDVVIHYLNYLKKKVTSLPQYTILLQPTSPLRKVEDIDGSIEVLLRSKGDSLVSLSEVVQHPFWLKKIVDDKVVSYTEEGTQILRRQDLPKVYNLNGAIYIIETEILIKNRSFFGQHTVPYIMPRERSIDIDDNLDWIVAETLMKRGELNE